MICKRKKIGLEDGQLKCPESDEHKNNIYHDTKYCNVCGKELVADKIDRYASFLDVLEQEDYIPVGLTSKLANSFYNVPIEKVENYCEILTVVADDVFNFHIPEDEGIYEFDCDKLQEVDFKKERQKVEKMVKPLLKYLYESIEIKFGAVAFFR